MMNRYKPNGWRHESARHALAAKGIGAKKESVVYWRHKHPELVKESFPGENPRITKDFVRYRQKDPNKFSEFRTKAVAPGKEIVLGKNKKTGEFELQSVLISKEEECCGQHRMASAFKVKQNGQDIGMVKEFYKFSSLPQYDPKSRHVIVYDDSDNIVYEHWQVKK